MKGGQEEEEEEFIIYPCLKRSVLIYWRIGIMGMAWWITDIMD